MSSSRARSAWDGYLNGKRSGDAGAHTHTRIGNKDLHVFGGSYCIPDDDMDTFWETYYNHVFVKKNQEFLTERQLATQGLLLVDVDMRFPPNVERRVHTKDHVVDLITLYIDKITELMDLSVEDTFTIYVAEKPTVNMLEEVTKDGIHMVMTLQMTRAAQIMLRRAVMTNIETVWLRGTNEGELPLQNSWNEVFDEGITQGCVNWQVYGSRKPGNKAYELKYVFEVAYDGDDEAWTLDEKLIGSLDTKEILPLMSARSKEGILCPVKDELTDEHERITAQLKSGGVRKSRSKVKLRVASGDNSCTADQISNVKELDEALEQLFDSIRAVDYEVKEAHQYAMTLPESYYGAGSYNKWIRVGWALKNTDPDRLLLSFIKFSSQQDGFTFADVPGLCDKWKSFAYDSKEGLKLASIIYWSKTDAPVKYLEVKKVTVSYFMEETLNGATEFDLANVLYHMFKDRFVCASIKGNIWYEYKGMRWFEIDSGSTLRLLISKQVHDKYTDSTRICIDQMHQHVSGDDKWNALMKRSNILSDICTILKRTVQKNNIMREARELFYDRDFIEKLDTNPYLLCFGNCVVDFKEMKHRKGRPDDYISKCTNIEYLPRAALLDGRHAETAAEVVKFMDELFPAPELRRYMWDHCASVCIGTNENQTFNIYLGSGANGKTMLVELMAKAFGTYKGTVPITLVTQKRNSIGGTSSEVMQLMGTRYAVMQEPSKGDKINEGIMKEITGGDPIQARALFKDSVTFTPQFKLVVCTNTLFDITSNDDGTWRRIRLCDFQSKFVEKPFGDERRFPKSDYPHQFEVDKRLNAKFQRWAPVFMSMLVHRAFEAQGIVKDCPMVLASSDQYREGQDYLAEFSRDKIEEAKGKSIKKTELMETFKQWYVTNYGRNPPKGREVTDYMDKKYGAYKKGWHDVKVIYEDEDADDDVV
jgi:P4 family phage/plasmid primase-like protien